jgi:hypothetical protein
MQQGTKGVAMRRSHWSGLRTNPEFLETRQLLENRNFLKVNQQRNG